LYQKQKEFKGKQPNTRVK